MFKTTSVSLSIEDYNWLQKNDINLAKFVRSAIKRRRQELEGVSQNVGTRSSK